MTIENVIEAVQLRKTGSYSDEKMIIEGINRVESYILKDVVSGRAGEAEAFENFGNYSEETARDKELFAPPPFNTVYVDYCCAQIERNDEDIERYTNSIIAYNNQMTQLKRWWWNNHRQNKLNRFFENRLEGWWN